MLIIRSRVISATGGFFGNWIVGGKDENERTDIGNLGRGTLSGILDLDLAYIILRFILSVAEGQHRGGTCTRFVLKMQRVFIFERRS